LLLLWFPVYHDCFGREKSNRRAIVRFVSSSPGLFSFRLSLLGGAALTAGPARLKSTLPSTSSSGLDDATLVDFGSLEGCEG
jgi:hypothetical protein